MDATNEEPDLEYPPSDTPMGSDDEVVGSDVATQTCSNEVEEPYEWTEGSLAMFENYGVVPPLAMRQECEEESKVDEDLREAATAAAKKLTIRLPSQNQHRGTNAPKLAPKARHLGDNKAKKPAEEADGVTEILDTPKASKKKRKKRKKLTNLILQAKTQIQSPRKRKKRLKLTGQALEATQIRTPANSPRRRRPLVNRGHPRKVVDDTPVTPKVWSVSVFVEIALPPKLQTGKTPCGDKFVNMPAMMGGPFVFMRKMTWEKFLEEVAEIVDVDIENLGLDGMTWGFQEKKAKLPLTNDHGFQTMRNQIKNHRDLSSIIIVVYHPIPCVRQPRATLRESCSAPQPDPDGGRVQEVPTRWEAKIGLDVQLAPIIEKLEEMYPVSACAEHHGIRCLTHSPHSGEYWHFELDHKKLSLWANAILRCETSYDRVPLGRAGFTLKEKMPDRKQAAPQTPGRTQEVHAQPNGFFPGYGPPTMAPMPHPSPHYYPYPPPSPFGYGAPPLWGYPNPNHPPSMPMPQATPSLPFPTPQATASLPLPASNTNGVQQWCVQNRLGQEEFQGLVKLGFHVGDDLTGLDREMWTWAGLGPLHKSRILAACNSGQAGPSNTTHSFPTSL
ncbi:uncharacterized protein LACBIDRAFT_315508 [Laccaria bicolor S238N-H82]|uniref:Predicted protein n=1 Tax=Laccaria bicolor (strain S238N-H82 / ATCC MYA-4686) TaxID=486041 RepID=B0D2J6_LACBS|nr:uncharacterized protein LACBIDRAFT_315508 [Laccaria bicolor S238N-H82]EDR10762.1 predicted protein [Laccaria bicolor S238N-H82]|eukprot:XP_001878063.1 predicted protein [Laccaria bicolor S238N-H82]